MVRSAHLLAIVFAVAFSFGAAADRVDVLSLGSDAWLRTGPSTSHEKIMGLPRGTAVVELADMKTVLKQRGGRWVHVHVLEGRAAGKEGWVWGRFVSCCESHAWLD
ncbi:MAG: SH3 domain-containing protein [Pseudomonadota bacterium]